MPQDNVQAHKWFNLAGSGAAASEEALRDRAIRGRERVAAAMMPEQIAEAQSLAREWESSTWTPLLSAKPRSSRAVASHRPRQDH